MSYAPFFDLEYYTYRYFYANVASNAGPGQLLVLLIFFLEEHGQHLHFFLVNKKVTVGGEVRSGYQKQTCFFRLYNLCTKLEIEIPI